MIVNEVTDPKTGKKRLHNFEPFTAETPEEEMLLHYLASMSGSLEDIEAATTGEIDNAVVVALHEISGQVVQRLDCIVDELRLLRLGVKS
jgi:hypothetical protein